MSAYKVKLPANINWEKVEFNPGSAWGTGNNGADLWGWTGGAPLSISDALKDGQEYYVVVTCENPDPKPNEQLAFIARYILDGKHGVFSAMLQE